ncbi:RNA methyltransferase [Patescibacteria group bacterium]
MKQRKLTPEEILRTKRSIKDIKKQPRMPIYVVLDNIRSLYNVGAIFRTSDGVMAEKIYLCGMTGMPPRREITKTSLGACETVPWEYRKNAVDVVKELKKQGVQIVTLELTDPPTHYADADFDYPVCLVIGHEIEGVSEEVMELSDKAISIPMLGRANSLNVATAYGIAVYQLLNKYQQNAKT